ncbi:RNA-binding (RRM/RBD/RNP motifs) family protein [Wolffia australiana]
MPRGRANTAAAKASEPVKQVEAKEHLEIDPYDYEEEFEYEEIEEEIEEEVEEEVEDFEEPKEATSGMIVDSKDDDDEKQKELLSLPPHGSEVYIGNIPQGVANNELQCFCERVGEVFEVRIMKEKDSAENRGYAFVTYRSKELALKAIKDLSGTELNGKKVKVSASQVKHRLFIGNVPRHWSEDDLKREVKNVGPGVTVVELKKDPQNSSRNRGFGFVEYYNNACAEYSRKKMSMPKFKLENNAPTVSWADPKNSDPSSNTQVKALYVKNLPKNVTPEQMKELFKRHGEITKVVLPPAKPGQENSRFGFVHFAERSMAMKALKNTERYELEGQVLDCSLAKPPADSKKASDSGPALSQKAPLLPTFPSRGGYGLVNPFLPLPPSYGATSFLQPGVYGREASAPSGLAMVPMLLPDGRMAYVLQQGSIPTTTGSVQLPLQQRGGGDRKGGGSFSGRGRHGSVGSGGGRPDQRYRPY